MISLRSMFVAAIILTPMPVLADVLGVSVGGGSWQASPEGDIGRTDINLESTLNLDEQNNQFVFVALEHPIPILPNIRLQHSEMEWNGEASLIGTTQQEAIDLDAIGPLLYGRVGVDIPLTGLSAHVLANWINVDEFRLIDWAAEIMYEFDLLPALDAGLILGYRSMLVELDDLDDLQADATFEGYYFALQLRF